MSQIEVSFKVYRGSESGKIVADKTTRTLGPNDVFIRIAHSGVCGTDEHFLHSGCVLGHEGVGYVEEIGPDVRRVKKGDRVGFGFVHKVCGNCEYCLNGREQYCLEAKKYGRADLDVGSFATHAVWDADMLFSIPDGLELKDAAPLMCAGATVWTALTTYGLKPGDRVGIQGIGGLGHLAIQFAAKLGCEVVVLSSSESKREEAKKLGATQFFVSKGDFDYPQDKLLNHLLICGSANPDYSKLIPLMAVNGTIYPLTVSTAPTPFVFYSLVSKGIKIQGSSVADRSSVRRMIDFATLHQIKPVLMEWKMDEAGIEAAMGKLRTGGIRYRAVLNA